MTVTLTPEMDRIVASRLSTGKFASADDVILEALHGLEQKDKDDALELTEFQSEMAARFESLDRGEFVDAEDVIARFAARRQAQLNAA